MSVFTTDITTYVNTTFTAAATGFSNANRTNMIALGESFCAMVTIENWENEFEPACAALIAASSFANLSQPKQIMMTNFAAYCINLAIDYYGDGEDPEWIRQEVISNIAQTGTSAPTGDTLFQGLSSTGGAIVITYVGVGEYDVEVQDPDTAVTAANSIAVIENSSANKAGAGTSANTFVKCAITSTNHIRIWTGTIAADTGTGAITGTAANAILVGACLRITQFVEP